MSPLILIRQLAATLLIITLSACSSTHAPTSPTPSAHPSVTITSISVSGALAAGGYKYRTVVHVLEGAGVAVTIASVDLRFMGGAPATLLVSSHHERPISDGANVCPASGTIATRELTTADGDASHPFAASVQATVTFTDGATFSGSASASADIPPVAPPPPDAFALTGRVTDFDTHAGIAGARLEVVAGVNGGKTTTTDATGTYVFPALLADSFRLRAAADGYDSGEQGVTVPTVPRADFELRRTTPAACAYSVAPTGSLNVSFVRGQFGVAITRTGGACGWRATSNAAWLSLSSGAGAGTASLTVTYESNAAFVGRTGTITIDWTGGSAQIAVGQAAESPAFCRIVAVTVGGRSAIDVAAGGGQFTASIVPEPGTPPGVCGPWTATASAGISFVGLNSGPSAPATLQFAVQPNTTPDARSLSVTISFGMGGPSPMLTINQAGAP